ncbi:MAG TPA: DUF5060 domain-containing protein, partial [Bacteroidia bacterium]|nr:DUF5060 domain-containing protein [Bacteroidia bacterium]
MRALLFYVLFLLPVVLCARETYETRIISGGGNEVKQYYTIEIGIRAPFADRMFTAFGVNPYEFRNFPLQAEFTCNGKSFRSPVFYFEETHADEKANRYFSEPSEWPWRVRFSPPDTGNWQMTLLAGIEPMTVPMSTGILFHCTKSDRHGWLQVADDHRHFCYADGRPFFVLGQNICWADEPVLKGHSIAPTLYNNGYYDVYHYLGNLADNGGNYVRIVMAPWSTGIEWEETGRYSQERAFALDSMLKIAEEKNLQVQLCLDLTTGFAADNDSNTYHPYRKSFQEPGMTASDLLTDSSALHAFDNFIRYVCARWAYSPNVCCLELMGEQDRWQGYAGKEKNFDDFFVRVNRFVRDSVHNAHVMITTSMTGPKRIATFRNPAIAIVDIHNYDNDLRCNVKRFALMHRSDIRKCDKPFLFGEMGMIAGPVNACDPNDYERCSDISMHNAMWATTFMGGAGAGLYWWQWGNDGYREANFPALRWFIDSVAGGMSGYTGYGMWSGNGIETFYSGNKRSCVGWAHNTSYWWCNMTDSCRDRNGKEMIHPKDDDKA